MSLLPWSECYLHLIHWELLSKYASTMTPSDSQLEEILAEMNHLSLKRQQLVERRKIQCIFQELRSRAEFKQTEGAASRPHASLDDQLGQLTERRAELQRLHDHILRARDANTGVVPAPRQIVSDVPLPVTTIFHVQSPPDFPAPTVILDVATLPDRPSRTQCPECKQFIVTETFHSVSSVTWMMCFLVATLGWRGSPHRGRP
ncbi:uncharacterized protein AB9W97_000622 isoform 2-T2 [Spinachia spinachia]